MRTLKHIIFWALFISNITYHTTMHATLNYILYQYHMFYWESIVCFQYRQPHHKVVERTFRPHQFIFQTFHLHLHTFSFFIFFRSLSGFFAWIMVWAWGLQWNYKAEKKLIIYPKAFKKTVITFIVVVNFLIHAKQNSCTELQFCGH